MDIIELGQYVNWSCHLKNGSCHSNDSSEILGDSDVLVTSLLGCILAIMCLVGMVGNIYTLVVINLSVKLTGSIYVYVVNLAVADLLYLSTIPFVVCTYFTKDWYFGEVGCRILFSLDLLTMHASIFTLTIMSTERYLAVVKPLKTIRRSKDYRRVIPCVFWLASFLLTLPTMVLINLRTISKGEVTKRICYPTWRTQSYKIYLTVLFNTSILAPGVVICYLYARLAITYWKSQTAISSSKDLMRVPKHKVLYMIFSIILAYWTCFIPFWIWQLMSIYHQPTANLENQTVVWVNFFMTCLTYSNSCVNPFFYTLLSKNYKEYLRSRQKNGGLLAKIKSQKESLTNSMLSGSHMCTKSVVVAQSEGVNSGEVVACERASRELDRMEEIRQKSGSEICRFGLLQY